MSDGGGHVEPVVVLGGPPPPLRLPAAGLALPAALLHPRLRDFLSLFAERFDAQLAEMQLEAAAESVVGLSLADLIGTGVFAADEAAVQESILRCGERCCPLAQTRMHPHLLHLQDIVSDSVLRHVALRSKTSPWAADKQLSLRCWVTPAST